MNAPPHRSNRRVSKVQYYANYGNLFFVHAMFQSFKTKIYLQNRPIHHHPTMTHTVTQAIRHLQKTLLRVQISNRTKFYHHRQPVFRFPAQVQASLAMVLFVVDPLKIYQNYSCALCTQIFFRHTVSDYSNTRFG